MNTRDDAAPAYARAATTAIDAGEIHLWFCETWPASSPAHRSTTVEGLLAPYLDVGGGKLQFTLSAHGKPHLAGGAVNFSVSHAAGALLMAVSRSFEVGVDLEPARRRVRPVEQLARRWFAADEASALQAFDADARQRQFLRMWTAKEALVKARGSGIAQGLRDARLVHGADGWKCADRAWQVVRAEPSPEWVASLAWHGPVCRLRAFVAPAIAAPAQSG